MNWVIDGIAFTGGACIVAGVFLLGGLAWALITGGVFLVGMALNAARMTTNVSDS